jgi:hypothetical protein
MHLTKIQYITSENYQQHLAEAGRMTAEMLALDADEKRTPDKVWEKRGRMATRMRNVIREIDTEVAAILEGKRSSTDVAK